MSPKAADWAADAGIDLSMKADDTKPLLFSYHLKAHVNAHTSSLSHIHIYAHIQEYYVETGI